MSDVILPLDTHIYAVKLVINTQLSHFYVKTMHNMPQTNNKSYVITNRVSLRYFDNDGGEVMRIVLKLVFVFEQQSISSLLSKQNGCKRWVAEQSNHGSMTTKFNRELNCFWLPRSLSQFALGILT